MGSWVNLIKLLNPTILGAPNASQLVKLRNKLATIGIMFSPKKPINASARKPKAQIFSISNRRR